MILSAEDFEPLPGVIGIDSPAFEAIATLAATNLDIVEPFEAIVVTPEFGEAPQFQMILTPEWEPNIPATAMGGGHAVALWELLAPEPEVIDDDDAEALVLILLLAA